MRKFWNRSIFFSTIKVQKTVPGVNIKLLVFFLSYILSVIGSDTSLRILCFFRLEFFPNCLNWIAYSGKINVKEFLNGPSFFSSDAFDLCNAGSSPGWVIGQLFKQSSAYQFGSVFIWIIIFVTGIVKKAKNLQWKEIYLIKSTLSWRKPEVHCLPKTGVWARPGVNNQSVVLCSWARYLILTIQRGESTYLRVQMGTGQPV